MAVLEDSYPAAAAQPVMFDFGPEFGISKWEHLSTREYGPGLQKTDLVSLNDGSRFVLRATEPRHQEWGTSCDFRPPLATRVKGFNSHMGLLLAEAGIYSRIIGTNQAHGVDMNHEAMATMAVLQEDDARQAEKPRIQCMPGRSIGTGYSMGKMDLLQELRIAHLVNRRFIAAVGIDECLADPYDLKEELCHPVDGLLYLGEEVMALGGICVREFMNDPSFLKLQTVRRWGHYATTISPSPQFIMNTIDKFRMLATGDTGKNLDEIPDDIVLISHFFMGSRKNHARQYTERLSVHPHFRAIFEKGVHLSGTDDRITRGTVAKLSTALEMDAAGASPAQIAAALDYPLLPAA